MPRRGFETSGEPRGKKLLARVRDTLRRRHCLYRTEKTYVHWIIRYIHFHEMRHPRELGGSGVEAFLTHLARDRHVAPSTQNQALSALLFLYRDVLDIDLGSIAAERARRPRHLPTVLSRDEVAALVERLDGVYRLMVELMYGSGLRVRECCGLRVHDIDFERRQIMVREPKGKRDRITLLPTSLLERLSAQVERVRLLSRAEA